MFKFDEICKLIRVVAESRVGSVEIEHGGSRLRIEGVPGEPVAVSGHAMPSVPVAPQPSAPQPSAPVDEAEDVAGHQVTSPIVGTFYRSPSPDADPYVKVGDAVEKGQVLCIVEAMKLFNEIESDVTGTIVKVFPENGQPVEFGEPLFVIKTE